MRINISGGRTLHAMLLTHITQHTFYPNMQHNFNLNQTNNKHKVAGIEKLGIENHVAVILLYG